MYKNTVKYFLLASIIINQTILATETIELKESYIKSDYVEVQNLKPTKNLIVIEKKDFIDKGYKNVSDILDDIPSINVSKSGWGSIDIRGQGEESADKNLQVLLDGAPITNLINHPLQTNYDIVPVENIERIEIIPSGGSVLYGSGSVGGIINITTNLKRMDKGNKSVSFNWGDKLREGNISVSQKLNDKLSLQLSYTDSRRDLYFKDTYRNSQYFSAGFNYKFNENNNFSFRYSNLNEIGKFIRSINYQKLQSQGKNYVPDDRKVTLGLDKNGKKIEGIQSGYSDARRELDSFNFSYNGKFNNFTYIMDAFYNKGNFKNTNLNDLTMYHTTKGIKNKLIYNYGANTDFEGSNILFGFDYYIQDADLNYNDYKIKNYKNKTYIIKPLSFNYDKKTKAFYIYNNLNYKDFTFTQGIRRDYTYWAFDKVAANNSGAATSKRPNTNLEFALAYNYRDTGKIYTRYERTFTSPDGLEITDDFSRSDIFPTEAKDTEYDIYEIGLRDKIGFSTIVLTAFYNNTDNEMTRNYVLDPILGFGRKSINVLKTKRKGFEATFTQTFGKLTLEESYAYLKGKRKYNSNAKNYDLSRDWTDAGLKKVPKHSITLKARYDFTNRFSANIKYKYSGKYTNFIEEDVTIKDEEKYIKSNSTVDLGATYKFDNGLTLSAGINNVFNEKYYEYVGDKKYTVQPAEERTYYMGIKYNF